MDGELKKVLIVDDDRIHLFTIQKLILLSQEGVKIKSYRDGQQAYSYLVKNRMDAAILPDVILLDLGMPGWNGWRFLKEYNKILPNLAKEIKLYIVSCSPNPTDISQALKDPNVCDYLSKPLTIETLNRVFERKMVK